MGSHHSYPVNNRVSLSLGLWYRFLAGVHRRDLGVGLQTINGTRNDARPANGLDAHGFNAYGLNGRTDGADGNDLQELWR